MSTASSCPFYNCTNLATVVLGENMTKIGSNMFSGCSGLAKVTILGNITNNWPSSSSNPFHGCSNLAEVVVGGKMTGIGNYMFSGCGSLTNVTILEGVTNIGNGAFQDCSGLRSVTIPESVIEFPPSAFDGCNKLWTSWYRTLANMSTDGGSSGGGSGGSSGGDGKTVSLIVTNVIVHYVTQSVPSGAVTPSTNSTGIVNIVAEVTANKAIAISEDWAKQYPGFAAMYGTDFSAALTMPNGKLDGTGAPMCVWQDYVAGTDPTDPTSVFTASVTFDAETGDPIISWSPELSPAEASKRLYTTYGKVRLTDPDWLPFNDNPSAYNFFRVTVEMK